ncbi:MAG TPA: helix-turn-helix transcriptional regulator [Pseudonocardia sp.]|jgi:transcriptional regulator with XRE-family HTH domain
MAAHHGSIIRRRILARRLERLRRDVGLTLEEAAPKLDWSVSKLSRIENAIQPVDVHGVRSMLDLYEVSEEWDELVELARAARKPRWYHAFGLGDNRYVGYEEEAALVREFAVGFIPGLLQTADYARALFAAASVGRTAQQLENEITVRMIRQRRLSSAEDPLELIAVIDEAVLRQPLNDPAVQAGQLRHLVEAAALDTVTVQVVPTSVGMRAAWGSGFTILDFGELDEPDIAYVEHALGALFLEKSDDVARARLVFDRVRADALGPAESLALIERLADET